MAGEPRTHPVPHFVGGKLPRSDRRVLEVGVLVGVVSRKHGCAHLLGLLKGV